MTSQPQPTPGEGKTAGQFLRQLRDLAAYALVGATAVLLFVAVLQLIPDGYSQFSYRTRMSFGEFVNLPTILFPLGAVLLAVLVEPRHPKARLIVLAALVEYAVAAVFGVFFGVLIGLINEAADVGARSAFEGLLQRVAWLAIFAVAGYAVFLIWRNLFAVPRAKRQPGVYGKPQYAAPGTFPGQPGYGPAAGQSDYGPAAGQPGYGPAAGQSDYGPAAGQPGYGPAAGQSDYGPAAGQPGFPPPAGYAQPQGFGPGVYGQSAPAWNQPPAPHPTTVQPTQPVPPGPFAPQPGASLPEVPQSPAQPPQPASPFGAGLYNAGPQLGGAAAPPPGSPAAAQPFGGPAATQPAGPAPAAPEPVSPPPAGQVAAGEFTDATHIVPPSQPALPDDRTQKFGTDRPGFGPAEPDPPRR